MTIVKAQMLESLPVACPSFAPVWSELRATYHDTPEGPPLYIALGRFALHIVKELQSGRTDELPAVFHTVELWHREGEHAVQEAATIGMLEALQNYLLARELDLNAFELYLLPVSRMWWDRLIRFWDGDVYALREPTPPKQ